MLTEDLTATLREHADDVSAEPFELLDRLGSTMARHRRRSRAVLAGGAVLAVAALTAGIVVAVNQRGSSTRVGVSVSTAVPCDTPIRVVPHYLNWPCPTTAVTDYNQKEFAMLRDWLTIGYKSKVTAEDLQYRILGFGPLPNARQGSTVVFAEVWKRTGHSPAHIVKNFSFLAELAPSEDRRTTPPGDPLPGGTGGGALNTDNKALLIATAGGFRHPGTLAQCEQRLTKPPKPNTDPLIACTDTIVARPDIVAIREVPPEGQPGPLIPVDDGLAGLDDKAHGRPDWVIQGLDREGNVIATTAYKATI